MYQRRTRRAGLLALVAATACAGVSLVPAHADDHEDAGRHRAEMDAQVRDVTADLDGSIRLLAEAEHAFAEAGRRLPAAESELADTRNRLERARAHDADAEQRLAVAVADQRRAELELHDVEAAMDRLRDRLGELARRSYQQGDLVQLSLVVGAATPAEVLGHLESRRAVATRDQELLDHLNGTRSRLDLRRAELARTREAVRDERERARERLTDLTGLEQRLATAAEQVRVLRGSRAAAVRQARAQRDADRRRHDELLAEQRRLTELVNRLNRPPGRAPGKGAGRGGTTLSHPVDAPVSSAYGMRVHPILEDAKLHTGTDFEAPQGTVVRAALEGVVIDAGWNTAYGYRVVVAHGQVGGVALTTTYSHLSRITARPGQQVGRGNELGRVGSTGYSTGAHLHFEVLADGRFVNPMTWL